LELSLNADSQKINLINDDRGALSARERKDYINAVKCLASKPNKTPASQFPGARNRYDDFVATHMNQTLSIHSTVSRTMKHITRPFLLFGLNLKIVLGKLHWMAQIFHLGI